MSNDNWNNQNQQQGWDPNQNPQGQNPQGQNPQQGGWDANQGQQQGGWDQPQQQGGWDQPQQQGGWDQPQQGGYDPAAAGWDPNTPATYGNAPAAPLASWGKRALGGLLDFVAPGLVISAILRIVFPADTSISADGGVSMTTQGPATVVQLLLSLALYGVLAWFSSTNNGQTWGRKIAKTQLLGENGQVPSLGSQFIRYIAHIVDSIICLIGWLFPLWDKDRQTLADKIMKTKVYDVSQTGPIQG